MAAEPPGMTDRLLDAMAGSAARRYGAEHVSELAHALQCAELAREAGGGRRADAGVPAPRRGPLRGGPVADLRSLRPAARAGGRGHHEVGADLIAPYVPERVTWLVRMHADAKRYLCSTEPGYHATLSPASQHTMTLQGGLMRPEEITRHAAHPWLGDALRLRRWDDLAKVVGKATAPLPRSGSRCFPVLLPVTRPEARRLVGAPELLEGTDLARRLYELPAAGVGGLGHVDVAAGVHDQPVRRDELSGPLARELAAEPATRSPLR